MKIFLFSILCGTAVFLAPQSSPGMLLVGFHDFDNNTNGAGKALANESADYAATGFSGTAFKNNEPSVTNGGSNDGYYGNTVSPGFVGLNPGINDGYLRIFSAGKPVIRFTNLSAGNTSLGSLLFDAASQNGNTGIVITYRTSASPTIWKTFNTTPSIPANPGVAGASVNYSDYAYSLLGMTLANGAYIEFKFDASNARIDNIALTGLSAIPEPGTLLALGCVLGASTFLRTRRRALPLQMA